MKNKRVVVLLLVSAVIAVAPLFIKTKSSQGRSITLTGWPWAHTKTVYTYGLCIGIGGGATNDNCYEHKFPRNNAALMHDYLFWFALISGGGLIILRITTHKAKKE
jgi:hypothetical protein